MNRKIRRLTLDDYSNLLNLWAKCDLPCKPKGRDSKSAVAGEMRRTETAFIGMFDDIRLIGVVLATSDGRKGWINRLAVDPDYQRRGLGMILINEAEKFLKELGLNIIAALIEDGNTASFAAFKKAGYSAHPDIAYYSKRSSPDI